MNNIKVDNFINSLDLNLSMEDQFRNALDSALDFKWKSPTLIEVMIKIEEIYTTNLKLSESGYLNEKSF